MINTQQLYKKFLESTGVSTDTRKIEEKAIFFALKGENFDGNQYAADALKSGAKYVVVDNAEVVEDERFLLVDDVLTSLQMLATYHRNLMRIPVIGLTGSNGKTTTKELIREILATKYNVVATAGNFNNHIGVPLTLLRITQETELAIIEMGANHIGEIATLCEIAQPTHGLITNIGKAHLEGFGNYEGVIRAKSELYHYLIEHNGVVFINSEDPVLKNMSKRIKEPIFYNNTGDYYTCKLISANPYVELITEESQHVQTNLIGTYNFKNIAAALCLGKYFKVKPAAANTAIADYVPENNRSQIINTKSNQIILDAYNANPISMKAALDNLEAMDHPNKVVILGDMFELGSDSDLEHKKIVEQVKQMDLSLKIFCGQASARAAANYDATSYFATKDKLVEYLKEKPITDKLILIKASRGMGLETIVEYL